MSPLGLGGDGLDGAHEDVRDDVDGDEAVDEAGEVEEDAEPPGPGHLYEEGQQDPLLRAHVLGPACRLAQGRSCLGALCTEILSNNSPKPNETTEVEMGKTINK